MVMVNKNPRDLRNQSDGRHFEKTLGQLQRLAMFYQEHGFFEKAEQLFEALRETREKAEQLDMDSKQSN